MKRIYQKYINEFLKKKIVLISGPRQSGQMTLSKMGHRQFVYLNFDNENDRKTIKEMSWDKKKNSLYLTNFTKNQNGSNG